MSFLSSIKRAFGFGGDDIDDELDEILNRPDNLNDDNDDDGINTAGANQADGQNAAAAGDHGRNNPAATATADTSTAMTTGRETATANDPDLAGDLFDGVLQVFNAALPDFVERSIDQAQQRKQLLEQLDNKLTQRLEEALDMARRRGLMEIAAERAKLTDELKRLSDLNKVLDERQRETNSAKLSAERQKRALNSRVHDLENQVAALEAEKEQLDLETKSMLSRMRAAGVAGQLPPAANQPALIAPPKPEESGADEQPAASASHREQELKQQLDEALASLESAGKQLADSRTECDHLTKAMEQLKAKQELSDAMINSLQSKASEARRHAEELQQQLLDSRTEKAADAEIPPAHAPVAAEADPALKAALAEANALAEKLSAEKERLEKELSRMATRQAADTSTIATLKAQAALSVERMAGLERQIAETAVTPEQMATIEQHVEQLSQLKENLTKRNRELKEENTKLRQDLDNARAHAAESLAELRMQREARALAELELQNLRESAGKAATPGAMAEPPVEQLAAADRAVAEAESAESSSLPEQPCTTVSTRHAVSPDAQPDFTLNPPEKKRRGRPRKNRLTAIAETVENNDWFRAPTEDESARRNAADRNSSDSDDFGYRQPPRRPAAGNDEQMSLW